MRKKIEVEFQNKKDYAEFLDGMTLTDRDYTELEDDKDTEIQAICEWFDDNEVMDRADFDDIMLKCQRKRDKR
jgi:hypothetical protein